jgi:3-oxoacyl-[acyl-carrier protein] reductase
VTTDLRDRVVLVTGGTRGIGRAIVDRLLADGARVAFTYRASREIAEAMTPGDRLRAYEADVGSFARAREVVLDVLQAWGRLDAVVNNAGIARDNPLLLMTEEAWDEVITTNLKGVFNYSRAAVFSMMKAKSGAIINIASVAGLRATPAQTAYGASKAAIIHFTRTLARELGSSQIRVNCIAPGFVSTEMTAEADRKFGEQVRDMIPIGRYGRAEEVAGAVHFLLSDAGSYVTGHTLVIDGGLSL